MKKYLVEQGLMTSGGNGNYCTFKETNSLDEAKVCFNELINDEKNYKDYCKFKEVLASKAYIETMLTLIDDDYIEVMDIDTLTSGTYKQRFLKEE